VTTTFEERCIGAMVGLAAGDALGTTLEFRRPGDFEPLTDMVGGGPFRLQPGEWTDDTSMALCLAESLLECGFDADDQLRRYIGWYREGHLSSNGRCFDIGNTVREALHAFERDRDARTSGATHEMSAGNGSIMRLAPVPIRYANDEAKAIELAGASSKPTHAHPEAVDACRYLAGVIVGAMQGRAKDEILRPLFSPVGGGWQVGALVPAIEEVASGSFQRRRPPAIKGSGYVTRSLEAALWAFATTETFEEGALRAVNLGDDADTTGAVFGQIAGAFYGVEAIPTRWREKLAHASTIESMARRLAHHGRPTG
jgi:ADP-ribosylglycohydrolase